MQKPAQIRAIFFELRRSLGPDVPSGDLLKIANLILSSYTNIATPLDEFGEVREDRKLDTLPVDIAFTEGWRLQSYERHRAWNFDCLESMECAIFTQRIEKYLGPEWRQITLMRPSDTLYGPTREKADSNNNGLSDEKIETTLD